jgi:hypothetical protein
MAYNTFNNVLDTEKEIEKERQCIICLEQTPSLLNENDNVTLLNDMHFLTKECKCLCYAHHTCIEKWIITNAVCPICKKTLAFPRMTVKKHNAVVIEIPTVVSNNTSTTTTSHICISIVISMFFVLVILQIIVRY